MTRTLKAALLALLMVGSTACATEVEPINLRDPAVSLESRKLLADLQDAISIARLKRDDARRALARTKRWRADLVEQRAWPAQANAALAKLRAMADGRDVLATVELELRQAELELAQAKYVLATAQTAMRHDLAVYELEPIRQRAESARAQVAKLQGQHERQIQDLDKLTQSWWGAYGDFVNGGGNSRVFYLSQANPPDFKPVAELLPKKEAAADPAAADPAAAPAPSTPDLPKSNPKPPAKGKK